MKKHGVPPDRLPNRTLPTPALSQGSNTARGLEKLPLAAKAEEALQ